MIKYFNIWRISAFFIAWMLSFPGWGAATFYEETWERATVPQIATKNPLDDIWYQGFCFRNPPAPYNTFEISASYARIGDKSVRVMTDNDNANFTGYTVYGIDCGNSNSDTTARAEIRYGYTTTDFESWGHGQERWIRMSLYIPSNEGTFSVWNAQTSNRTHLVQLFGGGGTTGGSPEVAILLKGGPKADVQVKYGLSATQPAEQEASGIPSFTLKKDSWNDIVIRVRRNWETQAQDATDYGLMQIWVNCADWASCTPVVDYEGPTAIRNFPTAYFKAGLYRGVLAGYTYVIYQDAIKMGKRDTETPAEMLALMTSDYTSVINPCPPDCPVGDITSVNSGSVITSEQSQVPFAATTTESIFDCQIGSLAVSPVKWDYTTNASGIFKAPVTTGLSSTSQTLSCWSKEYLTPLPVINTSWNATGTATDSAFSGSRFGYTAGTTVNRPDTENYSYSFYAPGVDHYTKAIAGGKMEFDFTYSCTGTNCENLYFAVIDDEATVPSNDMRNTAEGTAGALVAGTLNGGHGSWLTAGNRSVNNSTLGDDVYRVAIPFTVTNPTAYFKFYVGYKGGAASKSMTLHELIARKNATTKTLTYPVVVQVATTDITAPTVDNCTITNAPVTIDDVDSYKAIINCTTTEIGGDYFITLKDTNSPPADSDAVIAGTGALRSATGPVDSLSITAEFSGMAYQDLWGWIVHKDAADNVSAVASVSFDDGVGPGQEKKFKWSAAGGNKMVCYNTATGTTTDFNGDMSVIITDGDYFTPGNTVNQLAYDSAVTFTSGEAEMVEANLESGSINSLLTGDQGYNYWAQNASKSCRADNTIQLTVE